MFQSKWIMRSLVILLFALSGTALVLGIILFQQREMLKGRTQKLEIDGQTGGGHPGKRRH